MATFTIEEQLVYVKLETACGTTAREIYSSLVEGCEEDAQSYCTIAVWVR